MHYHANVLGVLATSNRKRLRRQGVVSRAESDAGLTQGYYARVQSAERVRLIRSFQSSVHNVPQQGFSQYSRQHFIQGVARTLYMHVLYLSQCLSSCQNEGTFM